jgi:predicted dehydrogenase
MTRSRREFLKTSTALGLFSILPSVPAWAQGTNRRRDANGRLALAVIGIGNQGDFDRHAFLATGLCDVVALCDVDLEGAHTHRSRYVHRLTNTPPELRENETLPEQAPHPARAFTDFRRMFDAMADEIDAVLIATPDHSHFAAAMLAMSLGKPVFVEKPLAHTFGQCARMIDLARRSGVVTQMGNQGHSGANYFQFKAWREAGVIRDVTRITAYMNYERRWHGWGREVTQYFHEPLPEQLAWDLWIDSADTEVPFSHRLHPQEWRSWFAFGSGAFGDWGPHILDTSHRFLELGLPETITPVRREGPNPLIYPQASTIRFSFPARGADLPACEVTWYDGVDNIPSVEPELGSLATDPETGQSSREPLKIEAPGKIIYTPDLVFQGDSHAAPLRVVPREKFLEMRRELPSFPQRNSNHYANFLLACLGEEEARSPFAISGELCQVFNLGMLAQQLGQEIEFDRTSHRVKNSAVAQALLDPPARLGWEEYYRL